MFEICTILDFRMLRCLTFSIFMKQAMSRYNTRSNGGGRGNCDAGAIRVPPAGEGPAVQDGLESSTETSALRPRPEQEPINQGQLMEMLTGMVTNFERAMERTMERTIQALLEQQAAPPPPPPPPPLPLHHHLHLARSTARLGRWLH